MKLVLNRIGPHREDITHGKDFIMNKTPERETRIQKNAKRSCVVDGESLKQNIAKSIPLAIMERHVGKLQNNWRRQIFYPT